MTFYKPEYLKECLIYYPETGRLSWRARPLQHFRTISGWRCFNTREAGTDCGSIQPTGYVAFRMDRQLFLAHRVAWVIGTNSEIPDEMLIDHINGNKSDNKLSNLRLATRSENGRNSKKNSGNALPKGVHRNRRTGKYKATVGVNGAYRQAEFDTLEQADAQAREWREALHGHFVNHGDENAS